MISKRIRTFSVGLRNFDFVKLFCFGKRKKGASSGKGFGETDTERKENESLDCQIVFEIESAALHYTCADSN